MIFTDEMRRVLMSTDEKYKYIWRSACGNLYVTTSNKDRDIFVNSYPFDAFDSLFEEIKPGRRPIRFRPDVLDDVEKEYLKSVLTPFRNRIVGIKKASISFPERGFFDEQHTMYRIFVCVANQKSGELDVLMFPAFDMESNMYKGMELNKEYTLNELGI